VTRRQLLEQIDRPALESLPVEPYVFSEWRTWRVGIDYHVEVAAHYYSALFKVFAVSADHCRRKIRRIPAQKCRRRLLELAHCSSFVRIFLLTGFCISIYIIIVMGLVSAYRAD
jgi:hypothetical protein